MRSWLPELTTTRPAALQQREVAQDDDDLGVERDSRADVEVVAGQHDEVERRGAVSTTQSNCGSV